MLTKGQINVHDLLLLVTSKNAHLTAIVSRFDHPAQPIYIEVLNGYMADEWTLTFDTQHPGLVAVIQREPKIETQKAHLWLRAVLPYPTELGRL